VESDVANDGKEKLGWVLYISLNVKIVLFFQNNEEIVMLNYNHEKSRCKFVVHYSLM
jgi:hypothetical protein